jgi:hypothetical protein
LTNIDRAMFAFGTWPTFLKRSKKPASSRVGSSTAAVAAFGGRVHADLDRSDCGRCEPSLLLAVWHRGPVCAQAYRRAVCSSPDLLRLPKFRLAGVTEIVGGGWGLPVPLRATVKARCRRVV